MPGSTGELFYRSRRSIPGETLRGDLRRIGIAIVAVAIVLPWAAGGQASIAEAEAGALEWTLALGTGSGLLALAAAPDGARVFATGWQGVDLLAVALDAATGDRLWSARESGAGPGVGFSVAASQDGRRAFVAGIFEDGTASNGFVAAYDAASGAQLWTRTLDELPEDRAVALAPTPDGTSVVVALMLREVGWTTQVVSLNAANGNVEWSHLYEGLGEAIPLALALGSSHTYVAGRTLAEDDAPARPYVLALDTDTGAFAWKNVGSGQVAGAWPFPSARLAADAAHVYFAETLSHEGAAVVSIAAYRAADGALAWETRAAADAAAAHALTSVALADAGRSLVVTTTAGQTLLLDAATGAARWTVSQGELLAAGTGSPGAGHAYVAGRRHVGALDTSDARALWSAAGPGALHWDAEATADSARVVVAGVEGRSGVAASFSTGLFPGLTLAPASQSATVGPLGEISYEIDAMNTGTLRAVFAIGVSGVADGWTAEASPSREVALDPGENATLRVRVWPPLNAVAGASWANVTLRHAGLSALSRVATTQSVFDATASPGGLPRPLRLQSPCGTLDALAVPEPPQAACNATGAVVARVNGVLAPFSEAQAVEMWGPLEQQAILPGLPRASAPASPAPQADGPARGPRDHAGVWEALDDLPGETVHAALLHTGRVSFIGSLGNGAVWDTDLRRTMATPSTSTWLFCAGHALLADGRWFAMGGTGDIRFDPFYVEGLKSVEIFDPETEVWTFGPNMTHARWYPTGVTLGDGRVAVFTGIHSPVGGLVKPVEVYDPATRTWTTHGEKTLPSYSKAYVMPDGKVFLPSPARMSTTWDPVTGAFEDGPQRLGGARNGGGSVLLDAATGRVLEFGGNGGLRTAEVYEPALDAWAWTGTLAYPRMWANAVLLPTGDVVAIGGENATTASLPLEYYETASGQWLTGPAPGSAFEYHSTALLLPDGSVLSNNQRERDVRIYKPWYFFAGERPRLLDAPDEVRYGEAFVVETPDAARVESAVLVRLGSVTHSLNTDSRLVPLDLIKMPAYPLMRLEAPTSSNVAPPGDYMLFLRDADGVPSEARFVRLAP